MEVRGENEKGDDVVLFLEQRSKRVLGRGEVNASNDPTVSRRQLLLELQNFSEEETGSYRVYVKVLGPNPICILRCGVNPSHEFLKKGDDSYLGVGDKFSLSVKHPHFFTLNNRDEEKEAVDRRQRRAMERKRNEDEGVGHPHPHLQQIQGLNLHSSRLSLIDPVAEFGFLVEGFEFEQFGKQRVHDIQWDWCLSKDSEKSDDDEQIVEEGKPIGRKGKNKKKKVAKSGKEDLDWMGESEEEKEQINKLKAGRKPITFKTRSKNSRRVATSNVSQSGTSKQNHSNDSIDNDDDETMGGFIVDDDDDSELTGNENEEDELTDDSFEEEDEDEDINDNSTR